jgi:phage FluMu protein Com
MRVQCESCQAKLNLPDEKLEPGTDFSFNCPKCKHRNTVRVPSQDEATPDAPEQSAPVNQASTPAVDLDDESASGAVFFEEGARPALVCFDEGPLRDKIFGIAKALGFTPVVPSSARDALQRIRMTKFEAIFIHENYDGQERDYNPVLRYIQPMDMTLRRRIFVVLFTKDFKTMDHMTAYSLSVNQIVNLDDEAQFDKILERGLNENRRFFKVFLDVLEEIGKI